jgi:hypothetical protein
MTKSGPWLNLSLLKFLATYVRKSECLVRIRLKENS